MLELIKTEKQRNMVGLSMGLEWRGSMKDYFGRFENLGFGNLPWVDTVKDELGEQFALIIVIGTKGTDVFDV